MRVQENVVYWPHDREKMFNKKRESDFNMLEESIARFNMDLI